MTVGVDYLSPQDLYFFNFAAHPVFSGVDTIYYIAAGEVAATTPAVAIAWTATNEPTIAALDEFMYVEEGKVAPIGASRLEINPNPFRHHTEIHGMTDAQTIRIFDVIGRLVATQERSRIGEGLREGVYFVCVDDYPVEKVVKLR